MIASLTGTIDTIIHPYIILTVSGVGYKVLVSSDILTSVTPGASLKLYTYTHVREDSLDLFGFFQSADLQLFEKLISVSGIGPKTAMGIFSTGTREHILRAIATADVAFFTAVPRLGKKNAQKLIIELKEKLGSLEELELEGSMSREENDVVLALRGLGFSAQEVQHALKLVQGKGETTGEKIKIALQYLGK